MKTEWPFTKQDTGPNLCVICSTPVPQMYDGVNRVWYPDSLYWNSKRVEVYCCPKHSLDRHEALSRVAVMYEI